MPKSKGLNPTSRKLLALGEIIKELKIHDCENKLIRTPTESDPEGGHPSPRYLKTIIADPENHPVHLRTAELIAEKLSILSRQKILVDHLTGDLPFTVETTLDNGCPWQPKEGTIQEPEIFENGLQWRSCECLSPNLPGVRGRGKLYDLSCMPEDSEADEIEARLMRHIEVCVEAGSRSNPGIQEHKNLVRPLWCGKYPKDNQWLVVDKWIEADTIYKIITKTPAVLDELDLRRVAFDILDGLEALHQADYVMRVLNPTRIYLVDQTPILTDFELAKYRNGKPTVTSGENLGRWEELGVFLAPEAGHSDEVRAGTDLYSWAAIVGSLAAKTIPDNRETLLGFIDQPNLKLPALVRKALHQCLSILESSRPQSVADLRSKLKKW